MAIRALTQRLLSERKVFFGSRARFLYELLGWRFRRATNIRFMNYGFAFDSPEDDLDLPPDDRDERYCAQLYHVVAAQADLDGGVALDVGSGRGGGASYVHRSFGTLRMIGCDLTHQAVAFCGRVHGQVPGLEFRRGDAMDLPFCDGEFDAVLNVESAHCYPDRGRFFRQVHRVLKPGGNFLFADFTPSGVDAQHDLDSILAELAGAGFGRITHQDITGNILRGLAYDNDRRVRDIRSWLPWGTRYITRMWAGSTDSWIYRDFRDRKRLYHLIRAERS